MTKHEDIIKDLRDVEFYYGEEGDLYKHIKQNIPDMWNGIVEKVCQYSEALKSAPPNFQEYYKLRYTTKNLYLDDMDYVEEFNLDYETYKKEREEFLSFLHKLGFPRGKG